MFFDLGIKEIIIVHPLAKIICFVKSSREVGGLSKPMQIGALQLSVIDPYLTPLRYNRQIVRSIFCLKQGQHIIELLYDDRVGPISIDAPVGD